MSNSIDLNGGLWVKDDQGRTVAVLLPGDAAAGWTKERDRLRLEVERLRGEAADLKKALESAREELKDKGEIAVERDMYLKSLHAIYAKTVPDFTAEDIAEADKQGLTLDKFIDEIEHPQRP
jgi:hypothetical protein